MQNRVFYKALLFAFLSVPFTLRAQTRTTLNTIYWEIGGNALFTSINYERQLIKNRKFNGHIGTGIYGLTSPYLTIPFGVNYLFTLHNGHSYYEIGMGATYTKADVGLYAQIEHRNPDDMNTDYWSYIPDIALRAQTKRNLMYRFSFSPVINQNGFLPFIGFSIGKSF